MNVNNSSTEYDDNYADVHIEEPIFSMIDNKPLYESEKIADDALG